MKHPAMRHLAFAGALAALSLPADAPAMKWGLIAPAADEGDPVLVLEGEGSWRPSVLIAPAALRRVRPASASSAADIWRRALSPDPCGDGQLGLSCPGQGADLGVGQGAPLAQGLGAPVTDWTRVADAEERSESGPRAGSAMGWMSLFPVLGGWAPVGGSTGSAGTSGSTGGGGGSGGGGGAWSGGNPLASASPSGGTTPYPSNTSGSGDTLGTVESGSGSSGGTSSDAGTGSGGTSGGSAGGGTSGGGSGGGSGGYSPLIPTESVPREPVLAPLSTPVSLPGTLLLMAFGLGALASVRSHRRPG